MNRIEEEYYSKEIKLIAGTDEAGRGPLAGPLVVAACILPRDFDSEIINDSKKLSSKKRLEAYELIKKRAIFYSIVAVSPEKIDQLNIYKATQLAMLKAFKLLNIKADYYFTDAMPLNEFAYPMLSIIKGDQKSKNIAAASILAKVTRDRVMDSIHTKYPEYGFINHKGYGTKKHLEAIDTYGPLPHIHRFSYRPIKK